MLSQESQSNSCLNFLWTLICLRESLMLTLVLFGVADGSLWRIFRPFCVSSWGRFVCKKSSKLKQTSNMAQIAKPGASFNGLWERFCTTVINKKAFQSKANYWLTNRTGRVPKRTSLIRSYHIGTPLWTNRHSWKHYLPPNYECGR